MIDPTSYVEPGATVGSSSRLWRDIQVRTGAHIGADCVVGKGVFIDVDVQVGDRCKIENYANLFRGAVVADDVFIGPMAVLTNDMYPRAVTPDGRPKAAEDWTVQGVTVRRGASLGAGSVVMPGVEVGPWALVGAGAVVTRDVPAHRVVVGNPARAVGWAGRCGHPVDDQSWQSAEECPRCGSRLR